MKKLMIFIGVVSLGFTACKSTKDNVQSDERIESRSQRDGKRGGGRMSPDQIIAQMDANKDGKIAKSEAKGPMADNFTQIDTNNDGYITLEEMKNAPKPERGQRGGRGK